MADVILSAKMSNTELLKSINATLKTAELKFDDFSKRIDTKMSGIGGKMASALTTQIDSIEKKINGLGNKVKNIGDSKSSISINVNNLESANKEVKNLVSNLEKAARESAKIRIPLPNAKDSQRITKELEKQLELLEKQRQARNQTATQTQRTAATESKERISFGGSKYELAMGMSTKSIQDRIEKIKALQIVQRNLSASDVNYHSKLTAVNREMARLSEQNKRAMTQGVELTKKNNALATSFANLTRRVVYYAGLGALTGFVKQLFTVRGEYEMLERSMGALLGDFSKGTALFNQITTQALKSPFTVMELASSAKQLLAYNFAQSEVAETTKRLADISSALGVSMERIIYNVGQIKAQGALTARDARDFANAGFAIVPMLAKLYTEQKRFGDGLVTTADVYDMMTKKMVSYGDVMQVIGKVTDEGGMFFDFQAKQAETLKGQLSNLKDAWDLMLNDIGASQQGMLTSTISGARTMLEVLKTIINNLDILIAGYGIYKAAALARIALLGQESAHLTRSVLATKARIAADLDKEKLTRTLTVQELALLATRKKALMSDYAAALASKSLTKEQAKMLVLFNSKNKAMLLAVVRTNLLTASQVRSLASMTLMSRASAILSVGLKSVAVAAWGMLKAFLPLLAITAVIGVFMSIKQKSDDLKESLKELSAKTDELRKSLANISLDFNLAIDKKNGLDEAKAKFEELIQFAKDTFKIDLSVDTSTLNEGEIVAKFVEIKKQVENIISASNVFSSTAKETDMTENLKEMGAEAQAFYDIVSINRGVISESLDEYISKLRDAGVKENQIFRLIEAQESISKSRGEDEAESAYLFRMEGAIRMIKHYQERFDLKPFNIFPSLVESLDKFEDATAKAGIEYDKFIKKMSKKTDLKKLTSLEFEGILNEYKTTENLSEVTRQIIAKWVNYHYDLEIPIVPLESSFGKVKEEVSKWVSDLQNWIEDKGYSLTLNLKVGVKETDVADEALKQYNETKELLAVQQRKLKEIEKEDDVVVRNMLLAQQKEEIAKTKALLAQRFNIAARAGADLSSITNSTTKEQSALAKAISDEVSLINKLSSNFDKLTKAGMSSKDAIALLGNEYSSTIESINKVLKKNNIKELTIDAFAGKDTTQIVELLKKQRGMLPKNAPSDAIKAFDVEIEKIQVDAKVFDFNKLNKKLKSSLDEIKQSWDLGLELEENDSIANVIKGIFNIKDSDLTTDINVLNDKIQKGWDEVVENYNKLNVENPLPKVDILTTSTESFQKKTGLSDDSGAVVAYKEARDLMYNINKQYYTKQQSLIDEYTYKLADNNGKILIEEENLKKLEVKIGNETNEQKKALLELQYRDAQNNINKLKEENLKLLPFYQKLFGDISNLGTKQLKAIYEEAQKVIAGAKEVSDDKGNQSVELSIVGEDGQIKKTTISLEEYAVMLKKIGSIGKTITEKNPIAAMVKAFKEGNLEVGFQLLGQEMQKVSEGLSVVQGIFSDLGADEETTEVLGDVAASIGGVATAAQGVSQIMSGDVIGGVTNVIKGTWAAISTWLDNSDKKIQAQIKKSEETIKDLANAYTLLEHTVEKAMGSAEVQAQRALVANKKLERQEIKRQIRLEESRKAKYRDEERIKELKQQYAELGNEISDLTENITATLLGSNIKEAAESFASTWIDAYRQGEDAMKGLNDSFSDMINNMIVKSLASTIVANRLKGIYAKVDEFTQASSEGGEALVANEVKQIEKLSKGLPELINSDLTAFVNALGLGKNTAAKSLSSLQQGIQGVTEQTAGVIEGYMNNVNGQVYLQSTLLQQLANNSNIILGTQSQMLLQMQQGYQGQLAIRDVLNGWSSNNGRSVRVEMV